jgi:hypothetical protein
MTAPGDNAIDPAEWTAFLARPSAYIHRDQLHQMFDGAVNAGLCERLKAEPRLKARLSSLIQTHYGLEPWVDEDACAQEDRAVAMLPLQDLQSLIRRAGAIYWSASIAALVLAQEILALYDVLSEELCVSALRHRDLSGPVQQLKPFDTLIERVDAAGRLCLAAWRARQPQGVAARVDLKFPKAISTDGSAIEPFLDLGPAIVRRAMTM